MRKQVQVKLHYCVNPRRNFGDDLNAWFWDRAAPGLIDDHEGTAVLGMGTILGRWFTDSLPADAIKVVIGSGAGEKGPLLEPDATWRFYGVRGPLTASYFDLDASKVLTDPAMLIHDFTELYTTIGRAGVGFMPHIWSTNDWDWERTCREVGLIYIDPRADSLTTLMAISKLEKLVTEAMHGAIVADAMRVPWVAARISHQFEPSKWSDWGGSLGVDVHFRHVPQLRRKRTGVRRKVTGRVKEAAAALGYAFRHLPLPESRSFEIAAAKRRLVELAFNKPTQLSSDQRFGVALRRLRHAIEQLRNDKARGLFS